ncbi:hypothetical protein C4D60_Mb01t31910 [Musa balbisiana]|uniref:indole-3-pyruvate monooxygenase n=1 Tax=Musa balbisiana TaxID=52838 RepID=A0A4S8JS86_MUSBA|nr:hypothetical protein C4D60_Mb01t31910 [Musa balbisiana]
MGEAEADSGPSTWLPGPLIVGAGPSGLAVAACLADVGIPSTVLEKSSCVASLWQHRTYDRLRLHLPKQFCELPLMGFPDGFPKYPSKHQFISYLESYATAFGIRPRFGTEVLDAAFDRGIGAWRVRTRGGEDFVSRWLIVATGENAEPVVPEFPGMERFGGRVVHTCAYRSGADFRGEKVHVLPREMLGWSTFVVTMALLRWLPLRLVDQFLCAMAHLMFGDTDRLGLRRPKLGPMELKNLAGKTPVLDVGALSLIRSGNIKDDGGLFTKEGMAKDPFPGGWKGEKKGLYCVGFTRRGLLGASHDALNIARDILLQWNKPSHHLAKQ